MKKVKCIIADDEIFAREVIQRHMQKIDSLYLVAECSNGIEVFNALKTQDVDLIFLDIEMPLLTGIELLKTLYNPPPVIITTAYRDFAIEGFELNVIDYLLKPISFERFLKAVDKFNLLRSAFRPGDKLLADVVKDPGNGFIYLKSGKKNVKIQLKDLVYIEGLKDYVKVHTTDKELITYKTLAFFEEMLSDKNFVRAHRSYIVSLNHINAYTSTQIEIGSVQIPIGSHYLRNLLNILNHSD